MAWLSGWRHFDLPHVDLARRRGGDNGSAVLGQAGGGGFDTGEQSIELRSACANVFTDCLLLVEWWNDGRHILYRRLSDVLHRIARASGLPLILKTGDGSSEVEGKKVIPQPGFWANLIEFVAEQ